MKGEGVGRQVAVVAGALLLAMAVASLLILIYGESPAQVYGIMLARTWGDVYGIGQVLFKSTPLLFTGLAVAVAFHAGLFNIGAEGQLALGSFATALVGTALPHGTPAVLALPLCILAGAAAGGLTGALPGALKARFGAHEVITTIMLNFIAGAVVLGLGRRYFFVEQTVHTTPVVPGARMPGLGLQGSAANGAFFLALVVAVAAWVFLSRTRWGFELRAVGKSPEAARAAGIPVGRVMVLAMTVSGALAGLVGSSMVLGYKGYFEQGMGAGTGFLGIAVALLARNEPLAVIPAALLFGTLAHGSLAVNALVPREILDVLEGVVILAIVIAPGVMTRLVRGGK